MLPEHVGDGRNVRLVESPLQRRTELGLDQPFRAHDRVRKPIRFRLPERLGKFSDESSVAVRVAEGDHARLGLGGVPRVEVVLLGKPEIWRFKFKPLNEPCFDADLEPFTFDNLRSACYGRWVTFMRMSVRILSNKDSFMMETYLIVRIWTDETIGQKTPGIVSQQLGEWTRCFGQL